MQAKEWLDSGHQTYAKLLKKQPTSLPLSYEGKDQSAEFDCNHEGVAMSPIPSLFLNDLQGLKSLESEFSALKIAHTNQSIFRGKSQQSSKEVS